MTAVDERMTTDATEIFENLEVPEGYKAELLWGDIVMMAGPDWVHNDIIERVADQIPRARWHRKQTQDIAIPQEVSEPQPDLVVLERGAFEGPGRLVPVEAVTLLVEVVSKSSVDRDYGEKRALYAAGGVPLYLIIDPMEAQCVLLSKPSGSGPEADYEVDVATKFGRPVPLEPLGVELDTTEFETLPPVKRHRRP
ncbi:Uma2 family endonuclease [Streptomyces pinistramenti]|uniref:Uma2 family endonuclease n=1 Tax=Streptomyces pinistramenti TaxID=2884812 RepID=UPI001D07A5B0|nr:Uma2 family endonuclease [Streptomyces pinistramenti]MCB5906780.1 Uma2 family endonuclease [Streptomyces pinistramenti]